MSPEERAALVADAAEYEERVISWEGEPSLSPCGRHYAGVVCDLCRDAASDA